MPDPKPTLDYQAERVQIVTGNASRAFWTMAGASVIGVSLLVTPFWIFVRAPSASKVGLTLLLFAIALFGATVVSILAKFTVARVQNGMLNFSFCGVRTRTIPLDSTTTFQIRQYGRLPVLVITASGKRGYVPNGALDRRAILELLRHNGASELPKQTR